MSTFKTAIPVLPVSDSRRLAAFYADKVDAIEILP